MRFVIGSIVLLVFVASGEATSQESHLKPFPRDRRLVYSYHGEVKAGTSEPAEYASQYAISADLIVEPFHGDPKYPQSFLVALRKIKIRWYNGPSPFETENTEYQNAPRRNDERKLENQFLIVFNASGKFDGVKILKWEPEYSKNMKKAIASMLQLNIDNSSYNNHNDLGQSLFSWHTENTIRGNCSTLYKVSSNTTTGVNQNDEFTLTKYVWPNQCTNYEVFEFDHYDYAGCSSAAPKNDNAMESVTMYKIKREADHLIIKSISSQGQSRYTSLKGESEAPYVLNNVSLTLRENEILEPMGIQFIFKNMPLITDLSYQRAKINGREDFTMYPSLIPQPRLIQEITEMLIEADDYIKSNRLDSGDITSERGRIINDIVRRMSTLQVPSFQKIFKNMTQSLTSQEMFFELLPHVGTHASSIFIKDLVVDRQIANDVVLHLLAKFPLNVRDPTYNLLRDMEPLIHMEVKRNRYWNDSYIYDEAMLSYASLIYQTFKKIPVNSFSAEVLEHYISFFRKRLAESDYTKKMNAIIALGNIGIGSVNRILVDIVYDEPYFAYTSADNLTDHEILSLRILAASSMKFTRYDDYGPDDLMPIIRNCSEPFELRISVYDTVVRNFPEAIYELDLFIKHDEDEHLYNYHYTTVEGLLKSSNPCLKYLAEGILENITMPKQLSYRLSGSHVLEGIDKETGKGEKFAVSYVVDRRSGFPNVAAFEHFMIDGSRWTSTWKIQILSKNVPEFLLAFVFGFIYNGHSITRPDIVELLQETAKKTIVKPSLQMHTVISYKNRAIFGRYYEESRDGDPLNDLTSVCKIESSPRPRSSVFFHENSERQVVSEMGLPINIENKIPFVITLRLPRPDLERQNLLAGFKISRHGYHSMSIYNPFGHMWHEIRRSTSIDVQLPITPLFIEINGNTVDISNNLVAGENMTYGISTYINDATAIIDENSSLLRLCPTCASHMTVKNTTSERKNYKVTSDIDDLGLQFSKTVFDCEKDYVHDLIRKDIIKAILKEHKATWKDLLASAYVAVRQHFQTLLPDSWKGTCGVMYKMKYRSDQPHLNLRYDVEDTDVIDTSLHILNGKRIKINGMLGPRSPAVNQSRHWMFNIKAEMNKEHTWNTLNMQLNRLTAGEKNLTVCVNAFKSYPEILHDPLSLNWTKEETTGKFEFSMTETEDGRCSRNGTFVDIRIKGELSDEQKEKFTQDTIDGACSADMKNPLLNSTHNTIPRTVDCLDHAIRYTTLRNYTAVVDYANLPMSLIMPFYNYADSLKVLFLPYGVYKTDASKLGTLKTNVVFPFMSSTNTMHRPNQSFPIHQRIGLETDRDLWTYPLDNTRFPTLFLQPYVHGDLRLCSVFPKAIRTFDGGLIPYNISSNWTLISADFFTGFHAVFMKNVDGILGWKIISGSHEMKLSPKSGSYTLTIDGRKEKLIELMAGTRVPNTPNWLLRVTTYGSAYVIESSTKFFSLIYTFDSVTLVLSDFLQGKTMGLCGRMDGTHKTSLPEAHYLSDV